MSHWDNGDAAETSLSVSTKAAAVRGEAAEDEEDGVAVAVQKASISPAIARMRALAWLSSSCADASSCRHETAASVAFQSFSCEGFDGGAYYLRADYSVRCSDVLSGYTSPPHEAIKALAWLAIGIYPCGVPALYTLLLLSQRSALLDDRPTVLTSALSFLHKDYRKACYLWEVVEVHIPTRTRMPIARKLHAHVLAIHRTKKLSS